MIDKWYVSMFVTKSRQKLHRYDRAFEPPIVARLYVKNIQSSGS